MSEISKIIPILETLPERDNWCVEFGAWDGVYLSNTNFLIENFGYKAVLIEGDNSKYMELKRNYAGNKSVYLVNALVGFGLRDGLDVLLEGIPLPTNFDFLSIDIDGNDYHVWGALCRLQPKIVCIEFNHTIPNEVSFVQEANPAVNQGCSLKSLIQLGASKGYELVKVSTCNAFFVRRGLFSLFGINDNSPEALRHSDAVTYIFSGYDGTMFLRGNCSLPWHGMPLSEKNIQHLPRRLRVFPSARSTFDIWLFRIYRMLKHPYWFFKQLRTNSKSG